MIIIMEFVDQLARRWGCRIRQIFNRSRSSHTLYCYYYDYILYHTYHIVYWSRSTVRSRAVSVSASAFLFRRVSVCVCVCMFRAYESVFVSGNRDICRDIKQLAHTCALAQMHTYTQTHTHRYICVSMVYAHSSRTTYVCPCVCTLVCVCVCVWLSMFRAAEMRDRSTDRASGDQHRRRCRSHRP